VFSANAIHDNGSHKSYSSKKKKAKNFNLNNSLTQLAK